MPIPAKEGVEHNQEDDTFSRLQLLAQQRDAMEKFWRMSHEQIEESAGNQELILPIARVKNVIRAKQDDMMLSADTPAFVTKLCELFVQELILRAWVCANSHNREIILGTDIAEAITTTESYHFLAKVVRDHQAIGRNIQDIGVSGWKRHKLDEMTSVYHPPQAVQVIDLASHPPSVPVCSPIGQMGTQHTPSTHVLMMQGESLRKASKEKNPLNEVMVPTNKVSMKNSYAVPSGGCATSSDVAIDSQKGETAKVFSSQNACPSLEDNYVIPIPAGHGYSFRTPAEAIVNQLHQEQQNFISQDAIVGEKILSNESLEKSMHMDEDLLFPEKDLPK
uniref:Core Histone H2A/H2B/H3 domain-containing protein n=1 Tax=Oryza punctata TaxID=4537 RepID=A0A0E0M687_ORYPU